MVKFPEAMARLFKNVFVDRKTKKKIRANPLKVQSGKVKSRGPQGTYALRPKRTK
ncbi:MAG: hypothetical protein ACMXX8_00385 [Candidatus Woesearchaeota archaeon]